MSLYETLFPFQKNIVDKFKDKDRYGLFLDCGLGKTLVSLAFTEVNKCTKVIVITINSKATETIDVKGSWFWWANRSDIKYNFYDKKIFKPTKKKPNNFTTETNDLLLLNFESLYSRDKSAKVKNSLKKELLDFINTCKGHNVAIIVDESHKIKDTSSLQNKAVNQIYKFCKVLAKKTYLYLGTGTIFTVGMIDTYAQLKLLGWEGTKEVFKNAFCVMGRIGGLAEWQQPIVGYKNVDQLYELIHRYGITIKSESVIDLPDKIFEEHTYPETLAFEFVSRSKMKMEILHEELKSRGLPYLIDDKIYSKMSDEDKIDYWQRLKITIDLTTGDLLLEGEYKIGNYITDLYSDVMEFLAQIFENQEDIGAFEWLLDYYYLFSKKETKTDPVKHYHLKTYKPNVFTNNPLYRNFAFPDSSWEAETRGTAWMRERQMSIGFQGNAEGYKFYDRTRLNMLKQFLEDNENNYVLFYNYTPELIEIYDLCQELGYNVDVYSGEVKSLHYYEEYEKQDEAQRLVNKKNIIVANFVSGSTGKNWQLYNQCIIFSYPMFKDWEQGLKRIHRTGQKETCVYHIFSSENYLDNGMRESLETGTEYNEDMYAADNARVNAIVNDEDDE